ncbi:SAP30-binding protein-like [Anneissia japonica]|uniref:SAP30-binding protein-like n=1 Tax=Anneissia japonica TaxID=1529436 RepID=UPI0014257F36|nr:SAP30-binding protein-like [Anneissia japonica]XP_033118592.1 SAP30-binding protein-like [Anneissia japonica]XP_033118593.1 SAP30-binding protein-like [Anneissia japonica]XP_033118594.1 SAP30-binding protein-like [Anneissia japonica]
MNKSDSISKMQSLVSYQGDSDADSDEEKGVAIKGVARLVSYVGEEDGTDLNQSRNISIVEEGKVDIDEEVIKGEIGEIDNDETFSDEKKEDEHNTSGNSKWSESVRHLSVEEIQLPPEPTGRCSKHLQDKIKQYLRRHFDLNSMIQNRKDFRNPSIYEKLINYMGIDELGSNYPDDVYNPHGWTEESFFESLAKAQKEDMAKREKERKTKVEFVTGTVKKPTVPATTGLAVPLSQALNVSSTDDMAKKRKSKWDVGAANIPIIGAQRPTLASAAPSSTNKTVISSVGALKKPKMEN